MDSHYDINGMTSSNQIGWLQDFWNAQFRAVERGDLDFKTFQLPLARIKKVMKTNEEVKMMISAESPIIFAKACEVFILELTLRAWIHTEESKRRTLQKNDVAAAISKADTFDFLIDIVPREESRSIPKPLDRDYRLSGAIPADQTPYFYHPSLPFVGGMPQDSRDMDQLMYLQQRQMQLMMNGIDPADHDPREYGGLQNYPIDESE